MRVTALFTVALAAAFLPAGCGGLQYGGLQYYVSDYRTWEIAPYRFLSPPPPEPLPVAGLACGSIDGVTRYVDAARRGDSLTTAYLRSEGPALSPPCLFPLPAAVRPVPGSAASEIASFVAVEADVAVDGRRRMRVVR